MAGCPGVVTRWLCIATLLLASSAGARAQVSLTLGDASLAAGDSGTVIATISTDGAAVALQFDILYDPDIVSLGTVNGGAALTGSHSIASNPISPGRDRVVITTSPVVALNPGTLATLNLAVADTAVAGTTSLTFAGVVISDNAAQALSPASLTPGTITITGGIITPTEPEVIPASPFWVLLLLSALLAGLARRQLGRRGRAVAISFITLLALAPLGTVTQAQGLPGDANGDGVIDAEDVRLIVERILERGVLPGDGDCTRDGTINVLDTVCSQIPFVPGETAPIILGPGDRSIPAEQAFEMNLFAADPDAGATQAWELVSGPAALGVTPDGVLAWTPGTGDVGSNAVTVQVTDDTGRSDEAGFAIDVFMDAVVEESNAPPQLTVPPEQSLPVGTPLSAQASATDPDAGDTLTYRLINGPVGMSIDPDTGALSWTPQATQARAADVVVEVTDAAGAVDFGSFTVTATPQNSAPTAVDDVYIARRGETLVIPAPEGVLQNDRDPQGDALAGTRLSDPGKGTIDAFNADGSFSYTPIGSDPITIGLVEKCRTAARVSAGTMSAADVDGDGDVELVGLVGGGRNFLFTEVFIVDPTDCSSTTAFISEALGAASVTSLTTLVNLDDDPELELVSQYFRLNTQIPSTSFAQALYAVNLDGSQLANWPAGGLSEVVSFPRFGNAFHQNASPVPVDLDGDGDTELIVGFTNVGGVATFNNSFGNAVVAYDGHTGEILWEYIGGITRTVSRAVTPTILDLDMDGDTEIIWNQLVLDHEGNLLFELPVEQTIPGGGSDFLNVAIANFDNDAFPEILGIDASNFYLYSHDGGVQWQVPYDSRGFAAPYSDITVAELDGDPFPEFVMMLPSDGGGSVDRTLRAFDSDGQPLWDQVDEGFVVETLTESQSSTPVAFDFDNDGIDELIQFKARPLAMPDGERQEGGLYIINGETGAVITFQPGVARNNYDQALTVADVDGDGSAEIITNMATGLGTETVQIWDNLPGEPFPSARGIRSGTNSHPTWINVDGSLPTSIAPHWLQPGRNGWHMIQPDIDPLEPERDSFTYRASDGEFDSAEAMVNIEVRPNGNPPFFLSEPDRATSAGISYRYLPVVVDVDPGDTFSFELLNGPAGMSIDPVTGELNWFPEMNGEYPVSLAATDSLGLSSAQIFRISVGDPAVVPDVVGDQEATAESALVASNLIKGDVFFASDPSIPSGTVLEQQPPAGAVAGFGAPVALTVSLGPAALDRDDDGDGYSESQGDCNDSNAVIFPGAADANGDGIDQDCDGIDGNNTLVSIEISPGSKRVLTNEPTPLTATGIFEDGTSQNLTAVANWTFGPTFFSGSAGTFEARASFRGVAGTADFTVAAHVADGVMPEAAITTPASGDTIGAPFSVTGIVLDPNILRYELEVAVAGSTDFRVIGSGSGNVSGGALGVLDPTVLSNDQYSLRLRVYDRGGNVAEDSVTIQVDGDMKVGNFRLLFTDLAIPMSGLPIALTRVYDSREKRSGDFGTGWFMHLQTPRLTTSRPLGTGWQVVRSGLTYSLLPTDTHIVSLTLADGMVERFELVVTPELSPIIPFPPLTQGAKLVPLPGTRGELVSLEEDDVSIVEPQPGFVTLTQDGTGRPYDPQRFRYIAPDGSLVDIHKTDGVERIEDANGNTLTIEDDRIVHSGGKSVLLEKDGEGRITRITDPAGHAQRYVYDTNGDLRSHTDREGNVTRFDYDKNHGLIRITDPLDRVVSRNEYDESGRLVRTTTAEGRVVELVFDATLREETVIDADGSRTLRGYDQAGNLVRVVDPLGAVSIRTYDSFGNVLSTTNGEGETTTHTYDARSNRLTSTNPLGEKTTFTYDSSDRRTSITDARGNTMQYLYDASGNLVRVTNPLGDAKKHIYDGAGNLVAEIDEAGNTQRYEYDAAGQRTVVVDPSGARETFEYDVNGHLIRHIDRRGRTRSFTLDANGQRTAVTNALNETTTYAFDALGWQIRRTDPAGNGTLRQVDSGGRPLTRTDRAGNTRHTNFDVKGNVASSTDARGNQRYWEHDPLDRMTGEVDPLGHRVERLYDSAGRLVSIVDQAGNSSTRSLDAAGRPVLVESADGSQTQFEFDAVGNRSTITTSSGQVYRFSYDALNRPVRTERPDGSTESREYDALGRLLREVDALGNAIHFQYDGNGNLIRVVDQLGGETVYAYDEEDNLVRMTDANGHATTFVYDALNREVAKVFPDGTSEQRTYDNVGNLASFIDPSGNLTEYSYDDNQRLVRKSYPGGAWVTYVYNETNQLVQTESSSRGVTALAYDALGRLASMSNPDGSHISHEYDSRGNVAATRTRTAPGAVEQVVRHEYDALNRLIAVTDADGGVTRFTYDAAGNRSRTNYPNGSSVLYSFDILDRLVEVEHRNGAGTFDRITYTLDAVGNRTRIDYEDGSRMELAYDALRRLVRERTFAVGGALLRDVAYSYDAVGNRLDSIDLVSGMTREFVYDASDKLLSAGSETFAYDPNGNLVGRSVPGASVQYVYDAEDRLVGVSGQDDVSFSYDELGNLVGKSTAAGDINYLVDIVNNTQYSQVVSEYDASGSARVNYTFGDDLLSQHRADGATYYHHDGLKSTRALTRADGSVANRYAYSATGELSSAAAFVENTHLFAGERYEPEADLYHLRARFLDTGLGRFYTRDAFDGVLSSPMSTHKYMYANANPVSFIDPSGAYTVGEVAKSAALVGTLGIVGFKAAALAREAALRGWVAWSGVNPSSVKQLLADPQAYREAAKIIEYFHEWYDLIEPELQSATSLGSVGRLRGRTLACGDHAGQLAAFLKTKSRNFEFKLFKFKSFNEHYFTAAYSGKSEFNVKHTYLVAHWEEEDVYINLDSWAYRDFAPRVPYHGPDDFWTSVSNEQARAADSPTYISPGGRSCPVPGI